MFFEKTLFDAKQQEEVLEERRLIDETTVVSRVSRQTAARDKSIGSNQEL